MVEPRSTFLQALREILEPCFKQFGSLVYLKLDASGRSYRPYSSKMIIKLKDSPEQTVDFWGNLEEEVDVTSLPFEISTTVMQCLLAFPDEDEEQIRSYGDVLIHRNREECKYT